MIKMDLIVKKLQWVMDLKNNKRGRIKEYSKEFKVEYLDGKNRGAFHAILLSRVLLKMKLI